MCVRAGAHTRAECVPTHTHIRPRVRAPPSTSFASALISHPRIERHGRFFLQRGGLQTRSGSSQRSRTSRRSRPTDFFLRLEEAGEEEEFNQNQTQEVPTHVTWRLLTKRPTVVEEEEGEEEIIWRRRVIYSFIRGMSPDTKPFTFWHLPVEPGGPLPISREEGRWRRSFFQNRACARRDS